MLIIQIVDGMVADARLAQPARIEPDDTDYTFEIQDFDVPDNVMDDPHHMIIDGDHALVYHVTAIT